MEVFSIAYEAAVTGHMPPAAADTAPALQWHPLDLLGTLPLTGLARKVLQRTGLMPAAVQHDGPTQEA